MIKHNVCQPEQNSIYFIVAILKIFFKNKKFSSHFLKIVIDFAFKFSKNEINNSL